MRAAVVAVVVGRTPLSLLPRRRPLRHGITLKYIEDDPERGVLGATERSKMALEGSCAPPFVRFPAFGLQIGLRGYHALHSSFGKVFNVEKRWKIIREMGSGAYGFVVFVNSVSFILMSGRDLMFWNIQVGCGRDHRGGRRYQARDAGNGPSAAVETGVERDHTPSAFRQPREHHWSY